jgi:hypothetical protein
VTDRRQTVCLVVWHVDCLVLAKEPRSTTDNHSIMPTFAPDLSQYWLPPRVNVGDVAAAPASGDESAAPALLQQLEALVERVNAARSVF